MTRLADQRGAVAIVTAIVAVALIGFAAVAVDLGNAYARKVEVQRQVDLAALAGAVELPESLDDARQLAVDYLEKNEVFGGPTALSVADFADGDLSNGEIRLYNGEPGQLEVIAPPANVNVDLGRLIGGDDIGVQAAAVAGVFSPGRLAPFVIPYGCLDESNLQQGGVINVRAPSPGLDNPTPILPAFEDFLERPPRGSPEITQINPLDVPPGDPPEVLTITGTDLDTVERLLFVWSNDPSLRTYVDLSDGAFEIDSGDSPRDPDVIRVTAVPNEVTELSGLPEERVVFVQVLPAGASVWSTPTLSGSFAVRQTASIPDECGDLVSGDFGEIDSPRADGSTGEEVFNRNLALGLDHGLTPIDIPLSAAIAILDGAGIPPYEDSGDGNLCDSARASELVPDELANRDVPPTCIQPDPGGSSPDRGMIEGDKDYDGRLDAPSSCGLTRPNPLPRGPAVINDDRLSCFIKEDARVADVLLGSGDLRGEIIESPRFLLVPVIWAEYFPGGAGEGQQVPIVDYRGAFISQEEFQSRPSNPRPLPDNGVTVAANKIVLLTATYFDLSVLPEVVSTAGDVIEYLGTGPKVVRLLK